MVLFVCLLFAACVDTNTISRISPIFYTLFSRRNHLSFTRRMQLSAPPRNQWRQTHPNALLATDSISSCDIFPLFPPPVPVFRKKLEGENIRIHFFSKEKGTLLKYFGLGHWLYHARKGWQISTLTAPFRAPLANLGSNYLGDNCVNWTWVCELLIYPWVGTLIANCVKTKPSISSVCPLTISISTTFFQFRPPLYNHN